MKERRLSYICKTDLEKGLAELEIKLWGDALTIPLFRLLPGRPKRTFSSLTAFLGGIFFFFAYARVEERKTVQLSRLEWRDWWV